MADLLATVEFIAAAEFTEELARGIAGTDGHDTAGAVFAEEQGLRALQNFELLHIKLAKPQRISIAQLNAIDIDRDGLIARKVEDARGDAPQGDIALTCTATLIDDQAWGHGGDIFKTASREGLELLLVESADDNRNILELFVAATGGDNDLLQRAIGRSGFLSITLGLGIGWCLDAERRNTGISDKRQTT